MNAGGSPGRTQRLVNIYISYAPTDARSQTLAEYIHYGLFQPAGVHSELLGVDDGTLVHINFEALMQARVHILLLR